MGCISPHQPLNFGGSVTRRAFQIEPIRLTIIKAMRWFHWRRKAPGRSSRHSGSASASSIRSGDRKMCGVVPQSWQGRPAARLPLHPSRPVMLLGIEPRRIIETSAVSSRSGGGVPAPPETHPDQRVRRWTTTSVIAAGPQPRAGGAPGPPPCFRAWRRPERPSSPLDPDEGLSRPFEPRPPFRLRPPAPGAFALLPATPSLSEPSLLRPSVPVRSKTRASRGPGAFHALRQVNREG